MSFLREIVVAPIRFYQRFLSPLKPPTCRFTPSCSAYAIQAVRGHGILRGILLAIWRILRCQPFCKGGFDPVPPGRYASGAVSGPDPGEPPAEPPDETRE